MTELQILTAVKNSGDFIDYVELMNLGKSDSTWEPLYDRDLINSLLASDTLAGKSEAYSQITFGSNGRQRLKQLQKEAEDMYERQQQSIIDATNKAKETKSQRRHEWLVAIVSAIIGAGLGVAGTLLTQYLSILLF